MVVTNIFSFSHNVCTLLTWNISFWVTLILSSAKAFGLEQSKILSFGKELNFVLLSTSVNILLVSKNLVNVNM